MKLIHKASLMSLTSLVVVFVPTISLVESLQSTNVDHQLMTPSKPLLKATNLTYNYATKAQSIAPKGEVKMPNFNTNLALTKIYDGPTVADNNAQHQDESFKQGDQYIDSYQAFFENDFSVEEEFKYELNSLEETLASEKKQDYHN